jgi:hypothetical protein
MTGVSGTCVPCCGLLCLTSRIDLLPIRKQHRDTVLSSWPLVHSQVLAGRLQGGDLQTALFHSRQQGTHEFDWDRKGKTVALQVAQGLHFLHTCGVIHRCAVFAVRRGKQRGCACHSFPLCADPCLSCHSTQRGAYLPNGHSSRKNRSAERNFNSQLGFCVVPTEINGDLVSSPPSTIRACSFEVRPRFDGGVGQCAESSYQVMHAPLCPQGCEKQQRAAVKRWRRQASGCWSRQHDRLLLVVWECCRDFQLCSTRVADGI